MDKNNSFNLRAWLWGKMTSLYPKYLKWHFKMDIGENAVIARTAVLDKNINPQGVHIFWQMITEEKKMGKEGYLTLGLERIV